MRILFYKAKGDWVDRLIRWWSKSDVSHVEIVLRECPDGRLLCASSSPRDGGVRLTWITPDPDRWETLDIDADQVTVRDWFVARVGQKYDWLGILGFVVRPARQDDQRWFCSEAVAASLGFTDPWRFDPAALRAVLLHQSNSADATLAIC